MGKRSKVFEKYAFLENIFDCIDDGVYIVNQQCGIEYVNPVLLKIFGSVKNRKCYQYFHDRSDVCPWCKNDEVFAGKTVHWEFFVEKIGKSYELIDIPLINADGSVFKLEFFRDITSHLEAEKLLKESNRQNVLLSELVEHSSQPFAVGYPDGSLGMLNEAFAQLTGYSKKELLTIDWSAVLTPPEWIESEKTELEKLHLTGKPVRYEKEYTKKDSSRVPIELLVHLVRDENGQPLYYFAFVTDITERKQAEEKLKESSDRLRRFYESDLMGVLYWNMNGQIVDANDKFLDMLGYSRDDLANGRINWIDMTPPEYRHLDDDSVVELKATGVNKKPFEKEYIRKDGTRVPILLAGAMLDEERFNGVAFVLDISDRKQLERSIEKQREEYRIIFDAVRPLIAYLDKEGVIQRINKSGAATFGQEPKEIVGKTMYDFFPTAEAVRFSAEDTQVITSGEPVLGSIAEFTLPSGQKRWAQVDRIPYFDENGDVTGVIMFNQDITRRKLAEDNLAQSYESLKKTLNDAINTIVKIVEMRDPYTAGHQQKVADLATAIAREMKFEETQIDQLRTAAVIHDIGKIYVPSDLLSKPGKLTDIEFSLIKTHAQNGYDIVKDMEFPGDVAETILQHHERLDGSGYPNGLKAEDTLMKAKILAVADVIEAMASHRPYRPALGIDKALEEISKNKGKIYDPDVVDACLALFSSGRFEFKPV
jgi:PAS domain S-box-containing protein/putative nucleotidyltransferase with HDIG domain